MVAEHVAGSQDGSAGLEQCGHAEATLAGPQGQDGSLRASEPGRRSFVVVMQTAQVLDLDHGP